MKSFYILLSFLVGVTLCPAKIDFVDIAQNFDSGSYTFFVKGEWSGEFENVIPNADEQILTCSIGKAKTNKSWISGEIRGESFRISGGVEKVDEIVNLLSAKVVKQGLVGDIFCVYLYAPNLKSQTLSLFNQRVNLQIAVSNGSVTVGYPIILGDY